MEIRRCDFCEEEKPRSDFSENRNICKPCRLIQRTARTGDNREVFFRRAISSLRHSRLKQGIEWSIDVEDLMRIYDEQEGLCALSGVLMTTHRDGTGRRKTNASIDRISPDLGYKKGNVQLLCWEVNRMKGASPQAEFWFWCENVSRWASKNQ